MCVCYPHAEYMQSVRRRGDFLSTALDSEQLGDQRQITGIVRLVVNAHGHLLHGEILDTDGRLQGRFVKWSEFVRIVCAWLANSNPVLPNIP